MTGDIRLLDPGAAVSPAGILGISGPHPVTGVPISIMDSSELWDDAFGETSDPARFSWFETAMHEIGHMVGIGHTDELPPYTLMDQDLELAFLSTPEYVFPGNHDIIHGQYLHRPESNDIDLYRFELDKPGEFKAEIIAERRLDSSLLDSVLTLYEERNGQRQLLARNDDYFSEDSFLALSLDAGVYYLAVTSTGNTAFDPTVQDSGFGGTTQGLYDLRMDFRPRVDNYLIDATGTAFDGDGDGVPGGVFNFWLRSVAAADQVFVDKAAPSGGDGSLERPFRELDQALNDPLHKPRPGQILRVVGNGGADGDLATLQDNLAYELGVVGGRVLSDGPSLDVPQGVTVLIDGGTIFKLLKSTIQVGSSSVTIDHSRSALQILGTPTHQVYFTSYDDEQTGVDTNPRVTQPDPGDWGGIIFQNDVDRAEGRFDYEQAGIYLNSRRAGQHALRRRQRDRHLRAAGGRSGAHDRCSADDQLQHDPPECGCGHVGQSGQLRGDQFCGADSMGIDYQQIPFTPDYDRVGPDVRGNRLVDNTINGMFVRIDTPAGGQLETLTVTGRWDDTEVVHVLPENLVIEARPGGPTQTETGEPLQARTDAGLKIDPGVVVKLDGARIETTIGAQLLAEGLPGQAIVLTSLQDERYGAGGTFATSSPSQGVQDPPVAGDWGGLYFAPASQGSIDYAVIAYAGGLTRVEGSFAGFNAVEARQAVLRLTHSILEYNANGRGGQAEPTREGRGVNGEGAVFVRAAQPIIVENIIRNTDGFHSPAVNIDVNSLSQALLTDWGRATGSIRRIAKYQDNHGPLVRGNLLAGNSLNGMVVRGGTLTTGGVWDDTDIVHIVYDEIVIPDVHTYGGLRLESSPTESLVVKLDGDEAGFKATGRPLDIDDRVGGMLHVVGQPGRPVVLTSLADDSVGAGYDPIGRPQNDTNGTRLPARTRPAGSFQIDLNFGPVIKSRPNIVEAVEQAARIWERLIEDPITITYDVELSDIGDGNLGAAVADFSVLPFDAVRQAMVNDGRPHESVLGQLPTFAELNTTLPDDPTNPFSVLPTIELANANAKALGVNPALITQVPSQFDPDRASGRQHPPQP